MEAAREQAAWYLECCARHGKKPAAVAEVVAKLRALEPLGYTDIIVRHLTDSHPKVLASLSRLAEVRKVPLCRRAPMEECFLTPFRSSIFKKS